MSSDKILSLLGLCLRGNHLAVGEEPVESVARAKDARVLLIASDAASGTFRRVQHFADAGQCLWLRLPHTKAELGMALGRSSVALVAVTDIGLANALVRRLAELDPVRYDEAAARLEVKARRAEQRRAEQLAHEKNVRTGRFRAKAAPETPAQPEPAPPPKKAPPVHAETRRDTRSTPRDTSRSGRPAPHKSRPPKDKRPKAKAAAANRFAHSRPVKKGKGSFRRKDA